MRESHLVVGHKGEVGSALFRLLYRYQFGNPGSGTSSLEPEFDLSGTDLKEMYVFPEGKTFTYMHICFPYSPAFMDVVQNYLKEAKAQIVIIHSTVPVGTTRELEKYYEGTGVFFVHSPIRGKHPDLYHGLRNFVKCLGGTNKTVCDQVYNMFQSLGLRVRMYDKPETTELGKLLSTTTYGMHIAWVQEQERICRKFGLNFDEAVTEFTRQYNEGYKHFNIHLDEESPYTRPLLYPGFIGGHCVMPNLDLLEKSWPNSIFVRCIRDSNETKRHESEDVEYAKNAKVLLSQHLPKVEESA